MSDVKLEDATVSDKASMATIRNILLAPIATAAWIIVFDPGLLDRLQFHSSTPLLTRLLGMLR